MYYSSRTSIKNIFININRKKLSYILSYSVTAIYHARCNFFSTYQNSFKPHRKNSGYNKWSTRISLHKGTKIKSSHPFKKVLHVWGFSINDDVIYLLALDFLENSSITFWIGLAKVNFQIPIVRRPNQFPKFYETCNNVIVNLQSIFIWIKKISKRSLNEINWQ